MKQVMSRDNEFFRLRFSNYLRKEGGCLTKQRLAKTSVLEIFVDQQSVKFLYTTSSQLHKVSMLHSAYDYHLV